MTKFIALRQQNAVGPELKRAAQKILDAALSTLRDDSQNDAIVIHEFRIELKRWRAFLRLLAPVLGEAGQELNVAARGLARELTRARDIQSALDAFNDLPFTKGEQARQPLSIQARKSIGKRLEVLQKKMETDGLTAAYRERAERYLQEAITATQTWPLDEFVFADLAAGLTKTYRRARRLIPKDWTTAAPEELHRLRQRVVDHRYQMELVQPLWPRLGKAWIDEAQRLRRRLGQVQDLAMLELMTRPGRPLAQWRSRLMPLMTQRRLDRTSVAKRLTVRLFAEKPKAFRRRMEALWDANAQIR
jgi:CHAD domain-containing protein